MKLFEVFGPHGHRIVLTRERWNHVLKHEIPDTETLAECLQDPDLITESLRSPDTWLYYRRRRDATLDGRYVCVVAQIEKGFILTAYQTRTTKEGSIVWKRNE